jgi:hypothetical protein
MLAASQGYLSLLQASGHPLFHTHAVQCPPIPLAPFSYSLLGRLSSLGVLRHGSALLHAVRQVSVKTALKKAQPRLLPGQVVRPNALTAHQLAAVADAAQNPPWLPELAAHVAAHPAEPCRYMIMEDLLHANS